MTPVSGHGRPRLPIWLRSSLRRKLVLSIIVVEVIMLALLLTNTVRVFNSAIEAQTRLRVAELTPVLDVALAPGVFRRDFVGTQEILDNLLQQSGGSIDYLVVLDERRKLFASAGAIDPAALPPIHDSKGFLVSRLDAATPLRIGTELVGELRFGLALSDLLATRRTLLWQGALIAVLEVVLATLVLTVLAIWLTRRLARLEATARAVAAGDYTIEAAIEGEDEISRLARNFNAMGAAVRARTGQLLAREAEIEALNKDLAQRVRSRTAELEAANKELEAFSYSVSHDLRAPLRAVDGFSLALLEDYGSRFDATGRDYLQCVRGGAQKMDALIDDMLRLSRVTRTTLQPARVDVSALAREIVAQLRQADPQRDVEVDIADGLHAVGDPALLRIMLDNLLDNAWKYTARTPHARIALDSQPGDGETVLCVRDNGAGFDMKFADKLFGAFQRLHPRNDFAGTGIGLATVARIVHRHGGRVWAEAAPDMGATFYVALPQDSPVPHGVA